MTDRKTSAAKDVHMESYRDSLLERYGVARNHFEHARDPSISRQHHDLVNEQQRSEARAAQGSVLERPKLPEYRTYEAHQVQPGSQQVRDEKASPELRPPEEMAKDQNRATHREKMGRDHFLAEQYRAALIERQKDAPDNNRGNDGPQRDQDYERSR